MKILIVLSLLLNIALGVWVWCINEDFAHYVADLQEQIDVNHPDEKTKTRQALIRALKKGGK